MKLKNILYRNFDSLTNDEKKFYDDNQEKYNLGICDKYNTCLLYTSPSPRDTEVSRMPSSA